MQFYEVDSSKVDCSESMVSGMGNDMQFCKMALKAQSIGARDYGRGLGKSVKCEQMDLAAIGSASQVHGRGSHLDLTISQNPRVFAVACACYAHTCALVSCVPTHTRSSSDGLIEAYFKRLNVSSHGNVRPVRRGLFERKHRTRTREREAEDVKTGLSGR